MWNTSARLPTKGTDSPAMTQSIDGLDLDAAWAHVILGSDASTRGWLRGMRPVAMHDSLLILAVANQFTRDRVETRLRSSIESLLAQYFGRPISLAVTIDVTLTVDPDDFIFADPDPVPLEPLPSAPPAVAESYQQLNPKYTFDSFVIGDSNRFAHAAAVAASESPGKAYNPLLIYGDSGLGKTHLLHAVGHYIHEYYRHLRVKCVSTEEMTNDFINSISEKQAPRFRNSYRDSVDVLLLDDIQFLESKIGTQEEFFHTFNALHTAQKQIVMTCDRPPRLLEALEPRLRSRFESGLITDIQPPALETRIAILRKKATTEDFDIESEVLEFIASRIPTNIRELEGALIRVTAFASLNHQNADLPLAQLVLRDLIPEGPEMHVTATVIMAQVASYYNVSIDDLCGQSRQHELVTARQIAMYLCRELTDLSLPRIGTLFGGRDHTTVMHANRKIRELLSERRSVFNQVTELTNRVRQTAAQA